MIEVLLKAKNRIYKIKKKILLESHPLKTDFAALDEFHRIECLCLVLYRYYALLTSDMRNF